MSILKYYNKATKQYEKIPMGAGGGGGEQEIYIGDKEPDVKYPIWVNPDDESYDVSADEVGYDNDKSGLNANNVQDAIDSLDKKIVSYKNGAFSKSIDDLEINYQRILEHNGHVYIKIYARRTSGQLTNEAITIGTISGVTKPPTTIREICATGANYVYEAFNSAYSAFTNDNELVLRASVGTDRAFVVNLDYDVI